MGARLKLRAGRISEIREIAGGGSYLSQSDLRANFGLGLSTSADEVEVRWPSGLRQVLRNVAGDRFYLIVEGKSQLQRQQIAPAPAARRPGQSTRNYRPCGKFSSAISSGPTFKVK